MGFDILTSIFPGKVNQALAFSSYIFLFLTVVTMFLYSTDTRMLMGVNVWLKPLKFSLSIFIFLLTSAYILPLLPYPGVKQHFIEGLLVITMIVEIACILFQASRGQQSHFNITDPIGRVLFPIMGAMISITYVTYAWILLDFFRLETQISPAMLWAIRLGIMILLFGGISGFMMASGLKHNIGVVDGGVGLPFTNWSTVAGDLRVSHFISLHALQMLPLIVLLMNRLNIDSGSTLAAVVGIGILHGAFAVLTLIQAINGHPFIRLN